MKILLPVDGSEVSLKAVRLAISLLQQGLSGSMVLANVQEPATLYEMVVAPDTEILESVSTAAGVDTLAPAETLLINAGVVYEREIA
ncbi:MAG: universal stress protein, partial [Rhodoferax sp.]|nr:universal stress protein [Rhodoferax sp.]